MWCVCCQDGSLKAVHCVGLVWGQFVHLQTPSLTFLIPFVTAHTPGLEVEARDATAAFGYGWTSEADVDLLTCVKRFAAVGQLTDLITKRAKGGLWGDKNQINAPREVTF